MNSVFVLETGNQEMNKTEGYGTYLLHINGLLLLLECTAISRRGGGGSLVP
jgi:hypothetical protein